MEDDFSYLGLSGPTEKASVSKAKTSTRITSKPLINVQPVSTPIPVSRPTTIVPKEATTVKILKLPVQSTRVAGAAAKKKTSEPTVVVKPVPNTRETAVAESKVRAAESITKARSIAQSRPTVVKKTPITAPSIKNDLQKAPEDAARAEVQALTRDKTLTKTERKAKLKVATAKLKEARKGRTVKNTPVVNVLPTDATETKIVAPAVETPVIATPSVTPTTTIIQTSPQISSPKEQVPAVDSDLTEYTGGSTTKVQTSTDLSTEEQGTTDYMPEIAFTASDGTVVYYDDNGDLMYFGEDGEAYIYEGEDESVSASESIASELDSGEDEDFVFEGLGHSSGAQWKRTDDEHIPFRYELGKFYIPFIDDKQKKKDEEAKRVIKTPSVDFSDYGIKGKGFFDNLMLGAAEKSVNSRIASITQKWDSDLRKTLHLGKIVRMRDIVAEDMEREQCASTAVKVANEASAQRIRKQYPARTDYAVAPNKQCKVVVNRPGVQICHCVRKKGKQTTVTDIRKMLGLE
jgi:hypothetical protein